jgi:tetratricopeptide (TPR) repeat protein
MTMAALRASAEDKETPVRVSEPAAKIIVNPFAVPGAARPTVAAPQQPPVSRRVPIKYQNPFASKSKRPPVDSPLRPGPVTRWRNPAALANTSFAKNSVINAEPMEPAIIPWDQLPPAEDLRGRAPVRSAEAKTIDTPLSSTAANPNGSSPLLLSQPAWLETEPVSSSQGPQTIFDVTLRDITISGQHSSATAQQRLIAAFDSDVLLASAEKPVETVSPAILSDIVDFPESWLEQAQQAALSAETIDGLTTVAELCGRGLRGEPEQECAKSLRSLAAWAHNRRGELLAEAQRSDDAINDFQLSISLDPQCSLAIHNRAVTLAQQNQYEAALRDFNRVVELNPGLAVAYRNRAETLAALGKMDEAAADFSNAIEALPPEAALYGARAYAYERLGRFDEALSDINRAIDLGANDPECFAQRGNLAAEQGAFDQALKDFRKALSRDPNCGEANRGIAWLMATCPDSQYRDPQHALAAADLAAKTAAPGDYLILDSLAAAYASVGQFDKAMPAAKQAIDAAPAEFAAPIKQRLALYEQGKPYISSQPDRMVGAASHESPSSPAARPSPKAR